MKNGDDENANPLYSMKINNDIKDDVNNYTEKKGFFFQI
jgi:hypothetical protein